MIKKFFKYPINYLISIVVLYSIYDYFEHIGRKSSTFEEHPWYWLMFNIGAILSFIVVVFLVKYGAQRILEKNNLVVEVLAIGIWLVLYITLLGPFIDQLFWPFDDLSFRFKFGPVFIILIAYFVIRLIINLIAGKNALYSK